MNQIRYINPEGACPAQGLYSHDTYRQTHMRRIECLAEVSRCVYPYEA